jgi:hypothetical protein
MHAVARAESGDAFEDGGTGNAVFEEEIEDRGVDGNAVPRDAVGEIKGDFDSLAACKHRGSFRAGGSRVAAWQDSNVALKHQCGVVRKGAVRFLEQNQSQRALAERIRGGFFLRKKPLESIAAGYSYSDFAIGRQARTACLCVVAIFSTLPPYFGRKLSVL